jgi:hypothetical protein
LRFLIAPEKNPPSHGQPLAFSPGSVYAKAALHSDFKSGLAFSGPCFRLGLGNNGPHRTRGKQQMWRLFRLVCAPALPACFAIVGICLVGITGAAAQASDETRQACTGDAMRLCSEFIPDVPKITACMTRKRAQVSRECRLAMMHEHLRYRRVGRAHCRYRHCR